MISGDRGMMNCIQTKTVHNKVKLCVKIQNHFLLGITKGPAGGLVMKRS